MRWFWCIIFVVLAAFIGGFAYLNRDVVPINYLDEQLTNKSIRVPMSALIAGVYFLGMLTGWTVVGFFRRTVRHVTERRAS